MASAVVIIGGDDSNTNAFSMEVFYEGKVRYTNYRLSKTIDGDLKNQHIETSLGLIQQQRSILN